ncbi:hypothetical protein AGMMS50229_13370 [Campylobacterota bacterium]|nr:hypothetical protein AGMMS50229_13370 [Campylobacterota bacterium]
MARVVDYKRYGEELGDILALVDKLNRYLSVGRRGRVAKIDKPQNDKPLLKVLKNDYDLTEQETVAILKSVAGRKSGANKAVAVNLSDSEKTALRKEIDALVARIGVTIRVKSANDEDYLRKVKSNILVRKGKILSIVHQTRERKPKAN